ncbi:MAG: dnaX [Oscillospiraceae bacterium]|jgi:DNA polymerase-3 subunit gamma/tau|nr:dnaX [Oscillospiraceae bacterium]
MYLALYRKWRPQIFDDVISQPHITVPLKNQVKNQRTAHAYLFTGSRGTGKTTCSKILAKAINCLDPQDGNPCLVCDVCKGIEEGSLLDVVEIDAASNNGVDSIRELRDEANFTPAVCKYRVYIIDEAHMLSTGAFNALLKIMEEPPPHVIFILATTEVHKVPATILSRCQRYDFRRIKSEDISERLLLVSEKEDIALEPDAADLIAKLSDGGMRDAFSILDQCISFSEKVDIDAVSNAVGIAGRDYLFRLSENILNKDSTDALQVIDELHVQMCDLERLCDELITHFRNIMIVKTVKNPNDLIVCLPQEMEQLKELSDKYKLNSIFSVMTVFSDCSERMRKVSSKRLEIEMALVRLCSHEIEQVIDSSVLQRIEAIESALKSGMTLENKSSGLKTDSVNQIPVEERKYEESKKSESKAELDFNKLKPVSYWIEILKKLNETDPPLSGILFGSKAYEYEDVMFIDSPNKMFSQLLRQEGCAARLSEAITKQTGKRYRLRLRSGSEDANSQNANHPASDPLDKLAGMAKKAGTQVNIIE